MTDDLAIPADARSQFARDGFVALRGVFSPARVEQLRLAIDAERLAYLAGARDGDPRYTHASIKSVQVISNLWRILPELADLSHHIRLARCAAALAGVDRLRVYHDAMFHKNLENQPVPWHQDEYYALIDGIVTAWMPLIPVDEATGSIVYARGSHRGGLVNIRAWSDAQVDGYLRDQGYERCATSLEPGDVLFHDGRMFHRSERPDRLLDRLAFSVFFFADGQRLRAQPFGTALVDLKYFPGCGIGDLADSPFNPVVHPGDAATETPVMPCPRPMPIFDRSFKADPFRFYDELRAEGPLVEVELPTGVRCWLVTDHALTRALFADPRLSKSSQFAGHNWHRSHVNYAEGTSKPVFEHLLTLDAPDHTRLRKIVSRDFQPAHVARMQGAIERIVDDALDDLSPDETIDYVAEFATRVPLVVICELLGVPIADRARFRRWAELLMSASEDEQALIPRAGQEMRVYLIDLARELTRGLPRDPAHDRASDSLYARLASAWAAGELTDGELTAMGFLLLVAGHETTAALLATGLVALHQTGGAWDQLCRAPHDAPRIVEELLRYCTPIEVATPRFARAPIAVEGAMIAPGDTVFLGLAAANRDPARFTCPHQLDAARDASGHLAFGLGSHFCLGARLARLEAEIAFVKLSARFPRLTIVAAPEQLAFCPGLILRGLRTLPVRLRPPEAA